MKRKVRTLAGVGLMILLAAALLSCTQDIDLRQIRAQAVACENDYQACYQGCNDQFGIQYEHKAELEACIGECANLIDYENCDTMVDYLNCQSECYATWDPPPEGFPMTPEEAEACMMSCSGADLQGIQDCIGKCTDPHYGEIDHEKLTACQEACDGQFSDCVPSWVSEDPMALCLYNSGKCNQECDQIAEGCDLKAAQEKQAECMGQAMEGYAACCFTNPDNCNQCIAPTDDCPLEADPACVEEFEACNSKCSSETDLCFRQAIASQPPEDPPPEEDPGTP